MAQPKILNSPVEGWWSESPFMPITRDKEGFFEIASPEWSIGRSANIGVDTWCIDILISSHWCRLRIRGAAVKRSAVAGQEWPGPALPHPENPRRSIAEAYDHILAEHILSGKNTQVLEYLCTLYSHGIKRFVQRIAFKKSLCSNKVIFSLGFHYFFFILFSVERIKSFINLSIYLSISFRVWRYRNRRH